MLKFPQQAVNARQWTEDQIHECLDRMMEDAKNINETVYITQALVNEGLYQEIWNFWRRLHRDNSAIIDKMGQIEGHLESKLYNGAIDGTLVPSVAKFLLMNSCSWKNKDQEIPAEPEKVYLEDAYMVGDEGDIIRLAEAPKIVGFEKFVKMPDETKKRWTEDEVMSILVLMEQESVVPNIFSHYCALLRHGIHKQIWGVWKDNYSPAVTEKMRWIEAIYQAKMTAAAAKGRLNAPMTIFALKNLFKMKEKPLPKNPNRDPNEIRGTFINSYSGIYMVAPFYD